MAFQEARYKPGVEVSGFATAAIVGGTFVKVAADKTTRGDYALVTCGAGDRAFGVAKNDVTTAQVAQDATSVERLVSVIRRGSIARMVAGGSITAGTTISADAAGKAITTPGTGTPAILGIAMNTVASGAVVEVDLF